MVVDKNRGWWLILFAGVLGLFAGFFVFPFLYGLSFDYSRFSLSPGEGSSAISFGDSGGLVEGGVPGGHVKGITNVEIGWSFGGRTFIPVWTSGNPFPGGHNFAKTSNHDLDTTYREIRDGTFGKSKVIVVAPPRDLNGGSHDTVLSEKWDRKGHLYNLSPNHRTDTSGRWDMEEHQWFLSSMWSDYSHNLDISFQWDDASHDYFVSAIEPFSPDLSPA